MNKTYLIYLDSIFMGEAIKLKQAIAEAQNYICTQQGDLAEVWLLNTDTHENKEVYRVASRCHVEGCNAEVLI